MVRKLALGLVALVFVAGCKGRQTQSDQSVGSLPTTAGDSAIDSTPLSFDSMGSDSGKISGLVTVFFGYDRATLDDASKRDIANNVEWMNKNPNTRVQIEGHCDNRGTIEYNIALGERRANAVKAYMVSLGVAADRISVISYGKERPLDPSDSEVAYAKNRRANFVPAQ